MNDYQTEQGKWLEQHGFFRTTTSMCWSRDEIDVFVEDRMCLALWMEYEQSDSTAKEALEALAEFLQDAAQEIETVCHSIRRHL